MLDFWNLIVKSNTFNFIVMLIIFAIVWQKLNISQKLEDMRLEIANFIEKSKAEKEKAKTHLATTQKEVANLQNDINLKLISAKATAENVFNEINKMTTIAIEKLDANVDKIIDNEKQKINSALTNETAQSAVDLAKEKLKNLFAQNPQLHEQHIEQSIETIDKIEI